MRMLPGTCSFILVEWRNLVHDSVDMAFTQWTWVVISQFASQD